MRLATASLALLLVTGCVVVNRTSRDHLADTDTRLDLAEPPDAAAARVVELFARRGASLVDRGATASAVLLRFKSSRQAITSVSGGGMGHAMVSGSTEALGSVYYVTLQPTGSGTRAWFFGRPSVQGREPCAPPGGTYPCDGVVQATLSAGWLLTGREEAEAIRGVILELTGLKGPTAASSAVEAPPPDVAFPERPAPRPPDGFLAATARSDFTLRVGPDESAAISAEVRSGQKIWAETSAMRGFRSVRTLDGRSGYAPAAAVRLDP